MNGQRGIYLRISVTDRCNLRCFYCHPVCYEKLPSHELLSYEEIARLIRIIKRIGYIEKVRLTGGEPLLRRDIVRLVEMIKSEGIDKICITTNGVLLSNFVNRLKGLITRINVSLDTLKREKFSEITGKDGLELVVSGIIESVRAGIRTKINTVVMKDVNLDEIHELVEFASETTGNIRFIEYMPFSHTNNQEFEKHYVPCSEVMEVLKQRYSLISLGTSGTSKNFLVEELKTVVGFITPVSSPFCHRCNRLRINAKGELKLCLHRGAVLNLKELLRDPDISDEEIGATLAKAISRKGYLHPIMGTATMIDTGG